jgi:hypothetical protein
MCGRGEKARAECPNSRFCSIYDICEEHLDTAHPNRLTTMQSAIFLLPAAVVLLTPRTWQSSTV